MRHMAGKATWAERSFFPYSGIVEAAREKGWAPQGCVQHIHGTATDISTGRVAVTTVSGVDREIKFGEFPPKPAAATVLPPPGG